MGAIVVRNIVFILLSFAFVSCNVLQNGYTNKYGQYVPKNPRFKLKDKQGVFPVMLDTISVYKMSEMYHSGKLVFPKSYFSSEERYSSTFEINQVNTYLNFYNNGRCLKFSIPVKDVFGIPNTLKESDLNPNNQFYSKNYYYSSNGTNIQIESFVYGDGQGHYVISDYTLDNSGDTLIMQDKYVKIIYKKETIPLSWNRYKIVW